jgi:hypothetical protein
MAGDNDADDDSDTEGVPDRPSFDGQLITNSEDPDGESDDGDDRIYFG